MNPPLATAFSHRGLRALVATLCASAALLSAHPAVAAVGANTGPYTQGTVAKADPYTDGAAAKYDVYTQGVDYGCLSWKGDRFDPYTQGADRQADTYGYLSWNGDASYPNGAASRA